MRTFDFLSCHPNPGRISRIRCYSCGQSIRTAASRTSELLGPMGKTVKASGSMWCGKGACFSACQRNSFSTGEFTKAGCRVASVVRHQSSVPDRQPGLLSTTLLYVDVVCQVEGSRATAENFVSRSGGHRSPCHVGLVKQTFTCRGRLKTRADRRGGKEKFKCALEKNPFFCLPLIPSHGDMPDCECCIGV